MKTTPITFNNIKYLIYYKCVPTGQTINQTYYKNALIKLQEVIKKQQFRTRS